jgi:aldehyde dehydrogenase (NAD+)
MTYGPAPESAKPALDWIEEHGGAFGHFIGGKFVRAKGGTLFETMNPATGKPLARVSQGTTNDVDAAVKAARAAQPAWAKLPGHERARHLYALARTVQKNSRLLAVLESLDNGKPIRETRDLDIPLVARHFYHHAGWAQLMESEFAGYGAIGRSSRGISRCSCSRGRSRRHSRRGTPRCSSPPSSRRSPRSVSPNWPRARGCRRAC